MYLGWMRLRTRMRGMNVKPIFIPDFDFVIRCTGVVRDMESLVGGGAARVLFAVMSKAIRIAMPGR